MAGRGYFCATGDFSKDAIAFAAANPIKLITGRDLLVAIAQMPAEVQRELLAVSTAGDYTTPTCTSCGIKMVARTTTAGRRGAARTTRAAGRRSSGSAGSDVTAALRGGVRIRSMRPPA